VTAFARLSREVTLVPGPVMGVLIMMLVIVVVLAVVEWSCGSTAVVTVVGVATVSVEAGL
jgi:hypothetical protein